MKQPKSVKAFKNELRNYRYYQERIAKLNELVEYCYDILGGVRAVDTSKAPIHSPPNKDIEYQIRDDIEKHLANIKKTQSRLDEMDEVLQQVDDSVRDVIIKVYIENKSIFKVSQEVYLSPTGLAKKMNKALKEILD